MRCLGGMRYQSVTTRYLMYSAQLLDHFEHPRNAGDLPDGHAHVRVENPACGDILELFVRLEGDSIDAITFRAKGCVPLMACSSAVTELASGKSLSDALKITRQDVERAVGGVPPASGHAAVLAADALQAVLEKLS